MIDWSNYNYNNTNTFSLKGLKCFARVVHIHDGDTFTAIIPLFDKYYKFSVRLNGIDTCEIASKNKIIQTLSLKARNRLVNLITGLTISENVDIKKYLLDNIALIYINCDDFDKYGRLLATVTKSDSNIISFSDILVKEKLAYVYDGKTKLTEEEQIILFTS
jgi:endonuclease YncB( thermonuclease family)